MRRFRVTRGTHLGINTTIGEVKTVRSKHMSIRRIFSGSRGMAAGAAIWLALSAGAALVGSGGLNTARALAQPDTGSAAVSTKSSATQHDKERAGIDALIDQLHNSLKITGIGDFRIGGRDGSSLWYGVTKA